MEDRRRMLLGQAVRTARRYRELSQGALAERVGVTANTVSSWERGATVPNMLHLGPLCAGLRVRPSLFIDLPDPLDFAILTSYLSEDVAGRP